MYLFGCSLSDRKLAKLDNSITDCTNYFNIDSKSHFK